MLTIKVRPGDAIAIGDATVITVSSVNGKDLMRLSIEAPQDHAITHARAGRPIEDTDETAQEA